MLFVSTMLDTLERPDYTSEAAHWDILPDDPAAPIFRRLDVPYYLWLKNRIQSAIAKFGVDSPQAQSLQTKWKPITAAANKYLDLEAWQKKNITLSPEVLELYAPPIRDDNPETINTDIHAKYLHHPEDHRYPENLRGYWKQVDACVLDLASWKILHQAWKAGWEKEHILRNVGCFPWPGIQYPNDYGLVCWLRWADRVKNISREAITISRLDLMHKDGDRRYSIKPENLVFPTKFIV